MSSDPEQAIADRVAVVTGGGRGLGRSIALELAALGAPVCVVGRDPDPLVETVTAIETSGGKALAVPADVAVESEVERLRGEVERGFGSASILVCNAGIAGPTAPIQEISLAEWDETISVNLRSAFLCARSFLPAMLATGRGDLLLLGSVAARRPLARRTPYCASKAALSGLTRSLALEVGESGVRVNCLSPGPVEGARMDGVFAREAEATGASIEQARQAYTSKAATGRLVKEEEVVQGAISLLASTGLTGVELDLSAGMFA